MSILHAHMHAYHARAHTHTHAPVLYSTSRVLVIFKFSEIYIQQVRSFLAQLQVNTADDTLFVGSSSNNTFIRGFHVPGCSLLAKGPLVIKIINIAPIFFCDRFHEFWLQILSNCYTVYLKNIRSTCIGHIYAFICACYCGYVCVYRYSL